MNRARFGSSARYQWFRRRPQPSRYQWFRLHPTHSTVKTYLMSTTVIPAGANGIWRMSGLSESEAATIAAFGFISAVGHESTAEAMGAALGLPVVANRITVAPSPGDRFLCFKLDRRPPEGAILDRETLAGLGYSWALMEYLG